MNERPIPEAAMRDEDEVEMLRVWIRSEALNAAARIATSAAVLIWLVAGQVLAGFSNGFQRACIDLAFAKDHSWNKMTGKD